MNPINPQISNNVPSQNWQHWQLNRAIDGIAWLTLDKAGESTNTLSKDVMAEFAKVLDVLDLAPPKGLIIQSGKSAGFIAGADITEFSELTTSQGASALIERGWHLYNRFAKVNYPTLALIRGHCMGGGLELALACRTIVVVDEPSTKLALPEVMLGIIPGWGGMSRLPVRIGAPAALDMMLTGKSVDAKKAKSLGLADACVPPRVMENAARELVLSPPPRRPLPFFTKLLSGPLKMITASKAKKQVAMRARIENYPAPYAIIDCWANYGGNATLMPNLATLITTNTTAKNLVRVFQLQDRLKRLGKAEQRESAWSAKRVHVIGAGVMGGDIAAWCALSGMTVTLQDQTIERIAPAIKRAYDLFSRRHRRDALELRNAWDRLIPDPQGEGVAQADVIIEAIFENLEAKQALFRDVESRARSDAILATNTSSLKIEAIRTSMTVPSRLVGIHFFNPVSKMPLVEVITAEGVDANVVQRSQQFVRQIDRLPLPVKSAPGFLVNAVLAPYMQEAMQLIDEGLTPETIDEAALAFGMPMGPCELIDTVGLDIAMAAGKQLTTATTVPQCLLTRVNAGQLGKKSGRGFYTWQQGKALKSSPSSIPEGMQDRLLSPLWKRTRQLVNEGVVADDDLADAGVIFGTGFAPYTGGPLNYIKAKNTNAI